MKHLSVAIQMDPIETINITADSTFALMLEAQARGHALFYYTPQTLSGRDGHVSAVLRSIVVHDVKGDHYALGEPERRNLSAMHVVLLRQDPPFDLSYITSTHLLERIHPRTLEIGRAHV